MSALAHAEASPALERERRRITKAAKLLAKAVKPVKVLRFIDWGPELKQRFFEQDAKELPRPTYPVFDPAPSLALLAEARAIRIENAEIARWVERQAEGIEGAALMLAATGTPGFFAQSRRLYGEPKAPLKLSPLTPWDLASSVRQTVDELGLMNFALGAPRSDSADDVAVHLREACATHFGDSAPTIEVVDVLSANALAGATQIRLRRAARFTDRDAAQLLEHEAYIHVATALNGRLQDALPILAASHPYNARFQEGLAVLAEILSGAMEMDRFARLADRVFAIQLAVDGADFLEVYRWFLERLGKPEQSYENTRRVFRGGVVEGGAPFTKDCVYLYGLLQASNTVRALFASGRADCLPLLFCGKLDVMDLRALLELAAIGLLRAPRFVPPWINDPRSLFALLTFATFNARIDLKPIVQAAETMLSGAPPLRFAS